MQTKIVGIPIAYTTKLLGSMLTPSFYALLKPTIKLDTTGTSELVRSIKVDFI